jgi:formylglycine-generating enzyme required for sulfatase activity
MRRFVIVGACGLVLSLGSLANPVEAAGPVCPADAVQSGPICIDKYENSVWDLSAVTSEKAKTRLIESIRAGSVTLANLTEAGAVQVGLLDGDLASHGCPTTASQCIDVYAVSIAGVTPATTINWFQAAAAARNSGKRLPTNQEWQVAAFGTPDTGGADDGVTTCNTDDPVPGRVTATGSRSGCVSDVGAFDMVGNVWEAVADWGDINDTCSTWISGDVSCFGGPGSTSGNPYAPGAYQRGGRSDGATANGVFAVRVNGGPHAFGRNSGFRSAR